MKKSRVLIIIIICLSFIPIGVRAESIADYRARIKTLEQEKAESENKSKEVQEKIDAAEARINEITNQIVQAKKDQETIKKEIAELEKQIDAKEEEIKDLITFYQVSENDNFYLKFIFGADNFEDLIYRFSVAEQLTDANDKLVDEMNDLVAKNEKKVKELDNKQKELDALSAEFAKQVQSLGAEKKKYSHDVLSADDEIEAIKKKISYYQSRGCSETADLAVCSRPKASSYGSAASAAANMTVSAKGFILPLASGSVSDYYGYRWCPFHGREFHSGTDIAAPSGTTVMASNKGEVVEAGWTDKGFGYWVMIYHAEAGYNYTTLYGHLSSVSVSKGQGVSRGQKIGEVGSTGNSTGPHLHFQAMYGSGYDSSRIFSPSNLVYIPYSW